ncbi:MAG: hypothetical protein ABIR55_14215 [Burkholderiaceae bacterium]
MAILLALLVGCAAGPALVDHGFGFDAVADSPGIDVLDYRYGSSAAPGVRMPEQVRKDRGIRGGTSTHGAMVRGDFLFVRWRIRATGEVLEDTVDLRSRLPRELTDNLIYFVVRQRQLEVYLVTPQSRAATDPLIGPVKFRRQKVRRIYPD